MGKLNVLENVAAVLFFHNQLWSLEKHLPDANMNYFPLTIKFHFNLPDSPSWY